MARKFQTSIGSTGKTILIVDDSPEYLNATQLILEREGHRVITADSGKKALAILKETPIDLILLDYFMPGMTGEQVVEELRKFNTYVQVILQTGYASENPPRDLIRRLDIQGYHDKSEGPDKLLLWTDVGLRAADAVQLLMKGRLGLQYILSVTPDLYKIQPLEDLLKGILYQVSGLLGISNSFLAVIPPQAERFSVAGFLAMIEENEARLRIHAGIGRFSERKEINGAVDAVIQELLSQALQKGSFMTESGKTLVPLRVGDSSIGIIYLEKEITNPSDVDLLKVFATQAAVAIQNSQLYEMATIDPLTGVFVRRFFTQWFIRELKTAQRTKKPISLLMLDMDNMKEINDTAGHLTGDKALAQFSAALKEATRSTDSICRYGGDEFIVLLPNSMGEGTDIVVRRVLEKIRSTRIQYPGGQFSLKSCLGVAILQPFDLEQDGDSSLTNDYYMSLATYLQNAADQSLYEAKKGGRDRAGTPRNLSWPEPGALTPPEKDCCDN